MKYLGVKALLINILATLKTIAVYYLLYHFYLFFPHLLPSLSFLMYLRRSFVRVKETPIERENCVYQATLIPNTQKNSIKL